MYRKTHLFPKLITPLVCFHLSTNQYKYIQQQYITSSISYMGYNKTWPVSLRYGDNKYSCLQLNHLKREALIRKIIHLRLLLFKPDTSQLVLAMLAWYQHVSGICFSDLEQHPVNLDYINRLWLNDFVRLMNKYKIELKLRTTFITQSQRHNDRHLFGDILTYTSSLLSRKKLFACRLYLQITLLSYITNLKGTVLLPNIMIGIRNTNNHHTFSWPLQKILTITLGNYGTVLCEVYTVAQILPSNPRHNSIYKDGYLIVQ